MGIDAVLGLGMVAASVVLVAVSVSARSTMGSSARRLSSAVEDAPGPSSIVDRVRRSLAPVTKRFGRPLSGTPVGRRFDRLLVHAGLDATVGESVLAMLVTSVAVGLVLWGAAGAVGALVSPVAVSAVGVATVVELGRRRRRRFASQLPVAVASIAASLRSGVGVVRSIDAASRKLPAPIADELARSIVEVRFGRDIEAALVSVSERMHNEDLRWVVEVIGIQRQVGGDLAGVLDQMAATMRERHALARSIEAMTTEGKVSAGVLGLLPVVIAGVIGLTQPDYFRPMLESPTGLAVAASSALLAIVGIVWMRRMISIDV